LEGFTGTEAVASRTRKDLCGLRYSPLTALEKLAAVEAVMDHNAVILYGTAPATHNRMVAEVVDRVDVVSDHLPCFFWAS
jgi:hypothetical protein